ncbi:glycosyltransferase 87 family protein [Streptomyces sp. FXJ1.172]|uniref:glycosyltransferase 87 family protein n=1 Tax=Streptomyces sp. FXJ1.172 TaxID=710705 RepID=UPI001F311E09|nr:glycosyltransferase 87 family protein [Streptomyces sp. FXJ1.172]WEO99951.1 glycosyltransferase 87 family protein [Streptomyces sp. FXJ1.172]
MGRRTAAWVMGHAGWCLVVSIALHILAISVSPPAPLDLRVYRDASPLVLSGGLYDYRLHTAPPIPLLEFTYPPFAALTFLPLAQLRWKALVWLWQAASVAALFTISASTTRLLSASTPRHTLSRAILWTAAGLWLEPVRHTLDQGQVNLLLGAVVLGALAVLRTAAGRGTAVGLAAAVKLTPGVGGLYFLATRQWRAAAWILAAAGAATAMAWQVAPRESVRYWTTLMADTQRIGPVRSVRNQSLRGALSRLLSHDAVHSPVWWPVLALVTVLAAGALFRALGRHDLLGILIAAELYGLLVCPISWSHHWIWCLPTMIWLAHGRRQLLSGVSLAAWILTTSTRLVPLLIRWEDNLPRSGPYPVLLAWPGTAYAVCALLSLLAVATNPAHGRGRESGRITRHPQAA